MAIEPIGTMTAMQVQSTVKVQPVDTENALKSEAAMESSSTPMLDATTASIAKASESNADEKKQGQQNEPDPETLKKAVEKINKSMSNTEAVYGIHEGTNRVTIKIIDKKTKETIKELPPEKTLDMISRVWEMAGILVDERR